MKKIVSSTTVVKISYATSNKSRLKLSALYNRVPYTCKYRVCLMVAS